MTEYPPDWTGTCSWHECEDGSVVKLNGDELCQHHFDTEMAAMGETLRSVIQMAMQEP